MKLPKYFYFRVKADSEAMKFILEDASDCDVVEVVHGEWEEVRYDEADGYYILYRCPHCGCERPKRDNYCKDCGAKMDGDGDV